MMDRGTDGLMHSGDVIFKQRPKSIEDEQAYKAVAVKLIDYFTSV